MIEKTLILIKPDGVERMLVGEIIHRFERTGLKLVALKMLKAPREILEKHYIADENYYRSIGEKTLATYREYNLDVKKELGTDDPVKIGEIVRNWTIDYVSRGPIVAMVLKGPHAIENCRRLCGYTAPLKADVGSIRGDYALDSPLHANLEKRAIENLVHASGNREEAEREIALWFSPEEIME